MKARKLTARSSLAVVPAAVPPDVEQYGWPDAADAGTSLQAQLAELRTHVLGMWEAHTGALPDLFQARMFDLCGVLNNMAERIDGVAWVAGLHVKAEAEAAAEARKAEKAVAS